MNEIIFIDEANPRRKIPKRLQIELNKFLKKAKKQGFIVGGIL